MLNRLFNAPNMIIYGLKHLTFLVLKHFLFSTIIVMSGLGKLIVLSKLISFKCLNRYMFDVEDVSAMLN